MARIILDFTEAMEFDNTPVPPGIYTATIDASTAQEIKVSKEKGTPYITLRYVITSPPEFAGRSVFTNYMIAGKGSSILRNMLSKLGLYSHDMGDQVSFDTNMLNGYAVKIQVRTRTRPDGTPVNEATFIDVDKAA